MSSETERIATLEERVRGNRSLVELQFKLSDRFYKAQHREFLRRAKELNHEARTLKAMQAKYPGKENVEQQFKTIDQELVKLQVAVSTAAGRAGISAPLIEKLFTAALALIGGYVLAQFLK